MEVVCIKKILVRNLLIYIPLYCVSRLLWIVTTLATLMVVWPLFSGTFFSPLWQETWQVAWVTLTNWRMPQIFFSHSIFLALTLSHRHFLALDSHLSCIFLWQKGTSRCMITVRPDRPLATDYGHTMAKSLILCCPNSNSNPKWIFGIKVSFL